MAEPRQRRSITRSRTGAIIMMMTCLLYTSVSELELTDDKYLENNKIVYSYTKENLYNGERYAVYAYVFQNESSAMEYFKLLPTVRYIPCLLYTSSCPSALMKRPVLLS